MRIKRLFIIIFAIGIIFALKNTANAASATINCDSTVNVNSPITISVSGSGVQWNLSLNVNGQTIATNSEVDNYQSNKSISFSGTYTPNTTGILQITLVGSVTEFSDGSTIDSFSSKSITVTSNASPEGGSSTFSGDSSSSTSELNSITSLKVGDKTYSKPNLDITLPSVDADTDSITVVPTTTGGASYTINGGSSTTVALKTGTNLITIAVNNGKTYKVRITRLAKEEEVKPNIIDEQIEQKEEESEKTELILTSLKVKNFELTPEFNPNIYSYTINVDMHEKNVDKLEIDAIPNISDATIEIIGNENLVEGENIITILVKSADGEDSAVYQIIVNKNDATSEIVSKSIFNNEGFLSDLTPFQRNLLLGFAGLVLLILVIVIIVLIKKAKKSKKEQVNYDETNSDAETMKHEEIEKIEDKDEIQEDKLLIQEEVEFIAEPENDNSDEQEEIKQSTTLDEEKASLMDEFFSYNQENEKNKENKKEKKKGKNKGKHF